MDLVEVEYLATGKGQTPRQEHTVFLESQTEITTAPIIGNAGGKQAISYGTKPKRVKDTMVYRKGQRYKVSKAKAAALEKIGGFKVVESKKPEIKPEPEKAKVGRPKKIDLAGSK